MKTTMMIVYSGLATVVLACFALLPTARADCREGCDSLFNTFLGGDALFSNTTGNFNTANGAVALYSNTTGSYNTASGFSALYFNTTGNENTATGIAALNFNTTGNENTANGVEALFSNRTGDFNTATGFQALASNVTGGGNTANGRQALYSDTTGFGNTAVGIVALYSNTTGFSNTANGADALYSNTTGSYNTASVFLALNFNTTGDSNTANGADALSFNTTGSSNTANGAAALSSNTTGGNNIALGVSAGENLTTGNNNIDIGNLGVAGESNTIRIGAQGIQTATYIAGISGMALGAGVAVRVNAAGQLGTTPSSKRFKTQIKPMDKASEAILALRPVTFRYKKELDPDSTPQFGLLAEEVAKINPDLVARDAEGKPYTVHYEAVNAMLLNEFLKEHRKVEEQQGRITELNSKVAKQDAIIDQQRHDFQAAIAEQQTQIAALASSLKDQASQLQKVTTQLELTKRSPRTVLNDH